jgi:hypothetical protein
MKTIDEAKNELYNLLLRFPEFTGCSALGMPGNRYLMVYFTHLTDFIKQNIPQTFMGYKVEVTLTNGI